MRSYRHDDFAAFGRPRDDGYWVNPDGQRRTKAEAPYSYSEFYLFGRPVKGDGADYSDRLWQWDHQKAERLWKQHCPGHGWPTANATELSAFMSEYHGKPLVVTALAEGCNASNGYPYWIVWWRPKAADARSAPAAQGAPLGQGGAVPQGESK